jgi:CarboxypepD_reg-like domain
MRNLLFFFILNFPLSSFAQDIIVTGKVIEKNDTLGVPGVRIVEKGTTNQIKSNLNGEFKIIVKDANAILVFSAVGMRPQEILLKRNFELIVEMELDAIICFFDYQQVKLFANSGLIHNPLGFQAEFSFPNYFGRMTINSILSYQTNLKQNDFTNALIEFNHFYSDNNLTLGSNIGFKRINLTSDFKANVISFESNVRINRNIYILGISKLAINSNQIPTSSFGGTIGFSRYIFKPLNIDILAKTTIYKKNIELSGRINRIFKRAYTFIDFYHLKKFTELSIGIGINNHYNLPKKLKDRTN